MRLHLRDADNLPGTCVLTCRDTPQEFMGADLVGRVSAVGPIDLLNHLEDIDQRGPAHELRVRARLTNSRGAHQLDFEVILPRKVVRPPIPRITVSRILHVTRALEPGRAGFTDVVIAQQFTARRARDRQDEVSHD